MDFIDYKLNNTSILSYFYNSHHYQAFYLLFMVSFFFCFIIDFVWGVKVLKVWEWTDYGVIEFVCMYLFMNISFVLSIYELYRVIKTLLKKYIPDENLFSLRLSSLRKRLFYKACLILGIVFFISPLYMVIYNLHHLEPYILIFPFTSITLITDAVTYFTGGQPVLEQFIHFNRLKSATIAATIFSAFIVTEGLNTFGGEWQYLRVPFYNIRFFTVPLSVLIGWIPLVVGMISMVNMVKHLSYKASSHKSLSSFT